MQKEPLYGHLINSATSDGSQTRSAQDRFSRATWREARHRAAMARCSEAQRQDSTESNEGQQDQDQDGLRVIAHAAPPAGKGDADHLCRAAARDPLLRIRPPNDVWAPRSALVGLQAISPMRPTCEGSTK
jgi:hypothetical protein